MALSTAALGSFIAGCFGTLILAAFAAPLAELAFKFGPARYFSLMVLGLIGAVVLASGSLIKAIGMIILGLLLGLVGTDVNTGVSRFAFGIPELSDGIGFISVAMGVFGFAETISNVDMKDARGDLHKQNYQPVPDMEGLQGVSACHSSRHGNRILCWAFCRAVVRCSRRLRPPSKRSWPESGTAFRAREHSRRGGT